MKKTVMGQKLRIKFATHGIIEFRDALMLHFQLSVNQMTGKDATAVQTSMRIALISEVYEKAGESHNDSVRVTRAQACAIILSLIHNNDPDMIELKAALLKAL